MTIEEIRNSTKAFLTARRCPERLGFPVTCPTEHTVKFPRKPFLAFLGEEEKPATNGELKATNTLE